MAGLQGLHVVFLVEVVVTMVVEVGKCPALTMPSCHDFQAILTTCKSPRVVPTMQMEACPESFAVARRWPVGQQISSARFSRCSGTALLSMTLMDRVLLRFAMWNLKATREAQCTSIAACFQWWLQRVFF